MGCCIAVALLIAWVRRAWFAGRPGAGAVDPGFAPVARRPGPAQRPGGPVLAATTGVPAAAGAGRGAVRGADRRRPGAGGAPSLLGRATLIAVAAGVALYAAVVALGRTAGVVEPGAAPVPWIVRDAALVLLAFAALRRARRTPATPVVGRTGAVLVGLGASWTVLALLDMHLLAPFVVAGGAVADLAFHGAGSAAVLVGVVVEVRRAGAVGARPEAAR